MVEVYFEDMDDGSVRILEATSGEVIDTLEPETNGFMRSTLRIMVRERRQSDIGAEIPFVIRRTVSDRIQLYDPATDRVIDLRAFGTTNAGAFARLLELAGSPGVAIEEQPNAAQLGVTAVASNQQERDQ
jgi:putative photosynthetic complex assembly protein